MSESNVMQLSPRAEMFLTRAARRPCPRNRTQVQRLIEQEQLPVFEQILAFQEWYGGIDLGYERRDGFLLGIVWSDGLNGFPLEDGRYLFECAQHPEAQLRFFLDQRNVFYVGEYPLAERFETYLESEALFDEMGRQRGWHTKYVGQSPRDDLGIDAAVNLPALPEASDAHLKWWGTDQLRVVRRGFWSPKLRVDDVWVYARSWRDVWSARAKLKGLTGRYD